MSISPLPRPLSPRHVPYLLIFCALLASLPSAVLAEADPEPPAAVFLVRHTEKMKEEDPRLTAAGHRRSAELVRVLEDAGLDAIYVTQWRRTRATAAPIAAACGLEPRVIETTDDYAQRIAEILRTQHAGEAVLVVGHSNTTPPVLAALGIEEVPEIPDHQYDDLFLVVWSGGEPRLLSLHYGDSTP